jgi:hypothetical protein
MRPLLAGLACLSLLAGCALEPREHGPMTGSPEREREFADVPVPRHFKRRPGSFSWERGRLRVCNLLYQGEADPGRTAEFMRQQLEFAGWKFVDKSTEGEHRTMNFAKGADRCRVILYRPRGERRTDLTITIQPAEEGSPSEPPSEASRAH